MSDNLAVMENWLRVLAEGELSAWPAVVARDVLIEFPFLHGAERVLQGFDAAYETIGAFWKIFEVFDWEDVKIVGTSDPALMLTTAKSRARTIFGDEYANSYVLLVRVCNGRIVRHTEYFDPVVAAELMRSEGSRPPTG